MTTNATTMQAAWYERFGAAAEVLHVGERPRPVAGPGEVLVKLRASGINPSDVKKRAGSSVAMLDEGFVIPNSDGAGVIEAVGEGVDSKRIGEQPARRSAVLRSGRAARCQPPRARLG